MNVLIILNSTTSSEVKLCTLALEGHFSHRIPNLEGHFSHRIPNHVNIIFLILQFSFFQRLTKQVILDITHIVFLISQFSLFSKGEHNKWFLTYFRHQLYYPLAQSLMISMSFLLFLLFNIGWAAQLNIDYEFFTIIDAGHFFLHFYLVLLEWVRCLYCTFEIGFEWI